MILPIGSTAREKLALQRHTTVRSRILKPKFSYKPISSIDIMNWIKYLDIKTFNNVISRDQILDINKNGFYIVNLDDKRGPGTHWVSINVKTDMIQYFD